MYWTVLNDCLEKLKKNSEAKKLNQKNSDFYETC